MQRSLVMFILLRCSTKPKGYLYQYKVLTTYLSGDLVVTLFPQCWCMHLLLRDCQLAVCLAAQARTCCRMLKMGSINCIFHSRGTLRMHIKNESCHSWWSSHHSWGRINNNWLYLQFCYVYIVVIHFVEHFPDSGKSTVLLLQAPHLLPWQQLHQSSLGKRLQKQLAL